MQDFRLSRTNRKSGILEGKDLMSKSTLIIDTIRIIRENPGITIDSLARELARSERTVYRWLAEICSDLKTRIYCEDGGYYIEDRDYSSVLDLTARELLAVRMSLKAPAFASNSPMSDAAHSSWMKIRAASHDAKLQNVDRLSAMHAVGAVPPSEVSADIAEALERATAQRHVIRVTYRSPRSEVVRPYRFRPYAVAFRRHSWYVVGHSTHHSKTITLKMARVHSVVDTGKEFEVPDEFSIEEYFKNSWEVWAGDEPVNVRIRFPKKLAAMMSETRRHPTQVIYPQPDGSIIFEVIVSGIEEIGTWIMGYGGDAEVLEPESLRQHVLEKAQGILALYAAPQK